MKKIVILLLCLISFSFSVLPLSARAAVPAPLMSAVNQIYNANFASANATIDAYIASNPSDPAGYLLRGMSKEWDQTVNNKRGALNGSIMADYQKANDLALAASDAAPDNLEKKIMLGNTYMYVAKKQVDMGHKLGGGNTLKKAKDIMLEVVAKNPNAYDAYFALGVFNYFAENVPSGLKWLAALLGFKGNRSLGIDYIRKAADNPNLTQGDAAFLLTYIYEEKEHNYDTALRYNNLLIEKYPGNPAFRYESGDILFHAKKYETSRQIFNEFFAFCQTKPAGFCNKKYLFLANYDVAASYMLEKNYTEAKKFIDAATSVNDGQYKGFNVDLDLWQGIIAKNAGKKEDALAFFKKVEAAQKDNRGAWKTAQSEMTGL